MEGGWLSPTKSTMVHTVQGPTQRDATTTDAANDAKHDVGSGAKQHEQYAVRRANKPMAVAGEQGVYIDN